MVFGKYPLYRGSGSFGEEGLVPDHCADEVAQEVPGVWDFWLWDSRVCGHWGLGFRVGSRVSSMPIRVARVDIPGITWFGFVFLGFGEGLGTECRGINNYQHYSGGLLVTIIV